MSLKRYVLVEHWLLSVVVPTTTDATNSTMDASTFLPPSVVLSHRTRELCTGNQSRQDSHRSIEGLQTNYPWSTSSKKEEGSDQQHSFEYRLRHANERTSGLPANNPSKGICPDNMMYATTPIHQISIFGVTRRSTAASGTWNSCKCR